MIDPRTPVLVGCGQTVQKERDIAKALSPLQLMEAAARAAAQDCGLGDALWDDVDTITSVRFVVDSPEGSIIPIGRYANVADSLAKRLGANPARTCYGPTGGNTPQYLINRTAEHIARGEQDVVLLAGAEALGSIVSALSKGEVPDWNEESDVERIDIGEERRGITDTEKLHGINIPVNCYPLFENALRGHAGRTVDEQQRYIGDLMAPFTKVAAQHPQAWFPVERSAEEIATVSDDNRYVGFPYTKYMNSVIRIDQSAAVLMMSVEKARALGVAEDRWVYLHGCADANDIWYVSERQNYHSSPAIRTMGERALEMAGWNIGDVKHIDLYSCFPSAVEIGRNELGIPEDDPRPLTVTGGLPYFGGAGNNYVMHAVATMMDRLRAEPGSKGLCTANGWYVTKHSMGLYSTLPTDGPWEREDPATYQQAIDDAPHPDVDESPQGAAVIETYTVVHDQRGPQFGLVMGRLKESDARFVAHVTDAAGIQGLLQEEGLERAGSVEHRDDGMNIFTLA